jgi:molybdate transport system substrate-binding protein
MALVTLSGVLALSLAGCGGPSEEQTPPDQVTLSMMVPCGLADPLREVATLFQEANAGVSFTTQEDNTVVLVRKALDGQRADLFFSMGPLEMDRVEEAGAIIPGTRRAYAANTVAILVGAGSAAGVSSVEDLLKPEIKSIAMPSTKQNSAGHYGERALKELGIWEDIKGKLVQPEFAVSVSSMVSSGKVDAGLLYRSCGQETVAAAGADKTQVAAELPVGDSTRIPVPVAVMVDTKHQAQAERFIEFLFTPEAQEALSDYLFAAPQEVVGEAAESAS